MKSKLRERENKKERKNGGKSERDDDGSLMIHFYNTHKSLYMCVWEIEREIAV